MLRRRVAGGNVTTRARFTAAHGASVSGKRSRARIKEGGTSLLTLAPRGAASQSRTPVCFEESALALASRRAEHRCSRSRREVQHRRPARLRSGAQNFSRVSPTLAAGGTSLLTHARDSHRGRARLVSVSPKVSRGDIVTHARLATCIAAAHACGPFRRGARSSRRRSLREGFRLRPPDAGLFHSEKRSWLRAPLTPAPRTLSPRERISFRSARRRQRALLHALPQRLALRRALFRAGHHQRHLKIAHRVLVGLPRHRHRA